MIEVIALIFALLVLIGGTIACLISGLTNSVGLEFVNPIWLYKKYKVNRFGAILIAILFNILCFPLSICYWLYKLCTVGRK